MKGLAFVLDPDGYWIEVIKRAADSPITNKFTFAQTMLRVKDPEKSLDFYCGKLGMTLLSSSVIGEGQSWAFSLYFLAHVPQGQEEAAKKQVRRLSLSFLLTSAACVYMTKGQRPELSVKVNTFP